VHEPVQLAGHHVRIDGGAVSLFHLRQDLRLAEDERAQPARHLHDVLHRRFVVDQKARVGPGASRLRAQHRLHGRHVFLRPEKIAFRAVAGRKKNQLGLRRELHRLVDARQRLVSHGKRFARLHRR